MHNGQALVNVVGVGTLRNKVYLGGSNFAILANLKQYYHDDSYKVEEAVDNTPWRFVPVPASSLLFGVLDSLQLVIAVYAEECHAVPDHEEKELGKLKL